MHTKAPLHQYIVELLAKLDHVLPGQAPILDFVHHNTLHGFQHLPFHQALAEFETLTGIHAYLPETQYRRLFQQGRINEEDLSAAFTWYPELQPEQLFLTIPGRTLYRRDIYRVALLFDLPAISISQLNWQIEELAALDIVQADVPQSVRRLMLGNNQAIRPLWEIVLSKFGLEQAALHPENMLDLSIEQAEEWLVQSVEGEIRALSGDNCTQNHEQMREHATQTLDNLLGDLGNGISLRGLILALTGTDILESIRPQLIRFCASGLDEGLAAWQLPERQPLGLYRAWRLTVQYDANPFLHELFDWQSIIAELPEDPIEAIILQLNHLEIPQEQWNGYLRRLALEIPGWSGMINWRQHHPHYQTLNDAKPTLADYLAIRLTLDRLWLNQICRDTWKIEAKFSALNRYFRKNLSEFLVRYCLYQGQLPEYLSHQAASLVLHAGSERSDRRDWQQLADLIWTWQHSPLAESKQTHSAHHSGWRLFRLCQHLGLKASDLQRLSVDDLLGMLNVLDEFSHQQRARLWLTAYEHHYREHFFQAIRANHQRGRWAERKQRPQAQIIFCMDDREEGIRRHLEEFNPQIETLGAAGFFGVAMNYQGLDDQTPSALCPIVVTPAHDVQEIAKPGHDSTLRQHSKGLLRNQRLSKLIHQGLRRNLFCSQAVIDTIAPISLFNLLGKSLFPDRQQQLVSRMSQWQSPKVATELLFIASDTTSNATPEHPRLGFTDSEQADRVAGLLRNTGLTYGFASLVVLMGHGSSSQNNPHLAAYDCGACSGRHGGPNARIFAAMANRKKVRKLLQDRGISIPEDTWFIGAEHNTCNESIEWYDLDQIPVTHLTALSRLQLELQHAQQMSAHERCRRLASAPRNPTPEQALEHMRQRAADFSQARPELGHATNAAAVVGRRAITQGAFFDRRVFLISYDPTQDPEGSILEGILLAVGPVGAGINLEYYFSTVNNERFGCGTKVPHNITGFFGVMEGASSDLRTGLPQQMVEIHEPMRLLLLVEAKTHILEQIYHRQETIRELVAGHWIQLSVKDPDSDQIFEFRPGTGFVPWQGEPTDMTSYEHSADCYRNQSQPVAPALIKQTRSFSVNPGAN